MVSMKEFKEQVLDAVLNKIGKRKDTRGRIAAILNPDNPETSSILTQTQHFFMANGQWIGSIYPHAKGLKTYADHIGLSSLSKEGKGLENAIKLETAVNTSKTPPGLSIFTAQQQEQPKKRKFYNRKEKEAKD